MIDGLSRQMVEAVERMQSKTPLIRENTIMARQYGAKVPPLNIAPPDLSALQRAIVLASRIGINTAVI